MQSLKSFYNRLASPSKKKIESRPESTTSLSAKAAQDISALNENLRRLLQSLRRYQDQLHTEDDFFNREEYMQARIVAIKGQIQSKKELNSFYAREHIIEYLMKLLTLDFSLQDYPLERDQRFDFSFVTSILLSIDRVVVTIFEAPRLMDQFLNYLEGEGPLNNVISHYWCIVFRKLLEYGAYETVFVQHRDKIREVQIHGFIKHVDIDSFRDMLSIFIGIHKPKGSETPEDLIEPQENDGVVLRQGSPPLKWQKRRGKDGRMQSRVEEIVQESILLSCLCWRALKHIKPSKSSQTKGVQRLSADPRDGRDASSLENFNRTASRTARTHSVRLIEAVFKDLPLNKATAAAVRDALYPVILGRILPNIFSQRPVQKWEASAIEAGLVILSQMINFDMDMAFREGLDIRQYCSSNLLSPATATGRSGGEVDLLSLMINHVDGLTDLIEKAHSLIQIEAVRLVSLLISAAEKYFPLLKAITTSRLVEVCVNAFFSYQTHDRLRFFISEGVVMNIARSSSIPLLYALIGNVTPKSEEMEEEEMARIVLSTSCDSSAHLIRRMIIAFGRSAPSRSHWRGLMGYCSQLFALLPHLPVATQKPLLLDNPSGSSTEEPGWWEDTPEIQLNKTMEWALLKEAVDEVNELGTCLPPLFPSTMLSPTQTQSHSVMNSPPISRGVYSPSIALMGPGNSPRSPGRAHLDSLFLLSPDGKLERRSPISSQSAARRSPSSDGECDSESERESPVCRSLFGDEGTSRVEDDELEVEGTRTPFHAKVFGSPLSPEEESQLCHSYEEKVSVSGDDEDETFSSEGSPCLLAVSPSTFRSSQSEYSDTPRPKMVKRRYLPRSAKEVSPFCSSSDSFSSEEDKKDRESKEDVKEASEATEVTEATEATEASGIAKSLFGDSESSVKARRSQRLAKKGQDGGMENEGNSNAAASAKVTQSKKIAARSKKSSEEGSASSILSPRRRSISKRSVFKDITKEVDRPRTSGKA